MQPHEVVRQVNGAAAQPAARPHSRQIAPTSRANGRFTTNTGANIRKAFEEERPMISKAQVLRELTQSASQSQMASTPPPAVRGMMARSMSNGGGGHNNSYSGPSGLFSQSAGPSPLSPSRPSADSPSSAAAPHSNNSRARSPPRLLGKALINSTNVLPDEIAAKAAILSSSTGGIATSPSSRPPRANFAATSPARGGASNRNADFEISLEKTSPSRGPQGNYRSPSRVGSVKPNAPFEDEVVLPGSTVLRNGPDRAGFKPQTIQEKAANGRQVSPLVGPSARPLTPPACTMAVGSPSKGVRALQHVQQSRSNDTHALSLANVNNNTNDNTNTVSNALSTFSATNFDITDLSMAQLLASYGVTDQDCVLPSALTDEGCTVMELAQTEGVQANLKTIALNQRPPANTFTTLVSPSMGCNEKVWILCTPGVGNQTRSVAVVGNPAAAAAAAGGSGNSPTKAGGGAAISASEAAAAAIAGMEHHILIDLSEWPMIDHGPSIIIPAFHFKASLKDHGIDRCLQYHVKSSNETLFACSTPVVSDSERGMLTLVPNPGACGSTTLTVYLEDVASIDPKTCTPMRSPASTVYLHTMRTENTASCPASNGDGTPHPPLSSSLPRESLAKIITPTPGLFAAVPISAKAAVHCDPQSGETSFLPDPVTAGAAPTNLHTPYAFPLPNLFEVREDSCLRDQLQGLLERTQAAAEALDDANGAATDLRTTTGRLDCAYPFSTVVSPCYRSIATPFELIASLYGPKLWRATASSSSSAASGGFDAASIRTSIDEAALSARLSGLTSSNNSADNEEVCALLERVAALRQIDGGAAGQAGALEALEALSSRRAQSLGFASMAEIGEKEAILQSAKVKSVAEEQGDVLAQSELLVDALLSAARCFAHYGRFVESLEAAETAAKAADKYIGKDSGAHLAALIAVGTANGLRGDYVGAAKTLETAVDISEMVNGSGSATTALVVMLLGTAYCQHGDVSTGISFLQRTLRAFKTILVSRTEGNATTVGAALPLLANDVAMRLALTTAFIEYWRVCGGESVEGTASATPAANEALHEVANSISVAEENIYQNEQRQLNTNNTQQDGEEEADGSQQQASSAAAIPAGFEGEALSPSDRSIVLSLLHSIVGTLLLTRREGKAIEHFEEAAQLIGKASEEEEEEGTNAATAAAVSNPTRLSSLKVYAAAVNASVVCARITANDMFNEANARAVESSLETAEQLVGERHPFYCRLVALLGQLTRFSDDGIATNVHVTLMRTRETLREVLCVPSIDAAIIASSCALTSLQQADVVSPHPLSGPERAHRLRLAVDFAVEAVEAVNGCDQLFGNTAATEYVLEHVVEPMCLAVFSAVHEPVPSVVVDRLEKRIADIRATQGDTSLRLMEPLLNFGLVSYLGGNYQSAHHFLSRALKVADTINLIFLLGHLFRPAVHLTASQAQERNRVAGDRLQIHQSVQFATILFAIAGVYVAQGNADDAQSTYLQAQAALELAHMQTSIATSVILSSLAKFLYGEGHYGDAIAHAEKSYSVLREFHLSVGSDSHNHYSVVPTAGKVVAHGVEAMMAIINERTRSKGYNLTKQYDGRHRFVVYL